MAFPERPTSLGRLRALATRVDLAAWVQAAAWAVAALAAVRLVDEPITRIVLLALAGAVLLARLAERLRTRLLVGLAAASLAVAAGGDLGRYLTSDWIRVWNVYHYYLGAKYFDELSYFDLYDATLRADAGGPGSEGPGYFRDIDRVRDLRTYVKRDRRPGLEPFAPAARFSEERWREFQGDVAALSHQRSPRGWRNIFTDRGYNATPFWNTLGSALAHLLPATSPAAMKALTSLDLLLLAATFWLVYRTFGIRPAALVVLLFALTPVNAGRLVGGFLQYDWFCAFTAGLCFYHRKRDGAAAALMAYAVMARIFPLAFVAAAGLPMLWRWWRRRRLPVRELRFFLLFGAACLVGVALGCLNSRGFGAWQEFAANLERHREEHVFGEQRVGLAHFFTHEVTGLDVDLSRRERREIFTRQEPLYLATAGALVALFLAATTRRRARDAFLLGQVPVFALTVSSRYYGAFLAILPLLGGRAAGGWAFQRFVAAGQVGLFGAVEAFLLADASRYAAYSLFNGLLLVFFIALPASLLVRARRARFRFRAAGRAAPAGPRGPGGRRRGGSRRPRG